MADNKKPANVFEDKYWKDSILIYIVGIVLAVFTGIVIYRTANPEWKKYQKEFVKIAEKKIGKEKVAKIDLGIRQIWNKELMGPNTADRCVTCHLGVDVPGLEGEDVPVVFRTHPNPDGLLDKHPLNKFGCTICHGGIPNALTVKEAHAEHGVRWLYPTYTREMQKKYKFEEDRLVMLQINCNYCHRFDKDVPGMDYINLAKDQLIEKNCQSCHVIDGFGGNIGPNLTYEGDKPHEMFDIHAPYYVIKDGKPVESGRTIAEEMKRRGLPYSVFSWHMLHFEEPRSITPTSTMPNHGFSLKEIHAMTMLMMSWRKLDIPSHYLSNPGKYQLLRLMEEGRVKPRKIEYVSLAAKKSETTTEAKSEAAQETAQAQTEVAEVKETPKTEASSGAKKSGGVNEELAAKGKELFGTKGCTACHTVGGGRLVGPDLKGVTERRDKQWIIHMILNPDSMQQHDPIAKQLLEEYKVPMPNQGVTPEEAEAIYEYLKSASK